MLFRNYYFPKGISPLLIKKNGKLKNSVEENEIIQKFTNKSDLEIYEEKEFLYIKNNKNEIYVLYLCPIAEGGLGVICFGYNISTGQWIAAKFLDKKKYNACEYKSLKKAKKLAEDKVFSFKHMNIILMELARGEELFELTKTNPVKWPLLLWLEIIIKMLEELQIIHNLHLVHRDLKLENILYSIVYGTLCIIDYGLTEELNEDGVLEKEKPAGTLDYFAPEILKNNKCYYNIKTDIYAMGVMLREILYDADAGPLSDDKKLKAHVLSMCAEDPASRPLLATSIAFFKKYSEEYQKQHPKEVHSIEYLKQQAERAERKRISAAKIEGLEQWKAFQRAIDESNSIFFNISYLFRQKAPERERVFVEKSIEKALLNNNIVGAKQIASIYFERNPQDNFAQTLKKYFELGDDVSVEASRWYEEVLLRNSLGSNKSRKPVIIPPIESKTESIPVREILSTSSTVMLNEFKKIPAFGDSTDQLREEDVNIVSSSQTYSSTANKDIGIQTQHSIPTPIIVNRNDQPKYFVPQPSIDKRVVSIN